MEALINIIRVNTIVFIINIVVAATFREFITTFISYLILIY